MTFIKKASYTMKQIVALFKENGLPGKIQRKNIRGEHNLSHESTIKHIVATFQHNISM